MSYFNFCDLAGSERLKKTMNVGDRLKESNNINTSLLVLGRCISAIRESQRQGDRRLVPFRESKLTLFFKRALSGHEDISMIVNINPSRDMFDESQHVLNFSAIARDIMIEPPKVDKQRRKSRFSNLMQARSTAACPIIEESVNEQLEAAAAVNAELLLEIEQLKQEAIEMETIARREVINAYKDIIAMKEETFRKQIEVYEQKIRRYERLNEKPIEVINLDSSSEDDDHMHDLMAKLELQQKKNDELIARQMELKGSLVKLEKENTELKEVLKDAQLDYMEQQTELESLRSNEKSLASEILKLQEQLAESEELLRRAYSKVESTEELNETKDQTDASNCTGKNTNYVYYKALTSQFKTVTKF